MAVTSRPTPQLKASGSPGIALPQPHRATSPTGAAPSWMSSSPPRVATRRRGGRRSPGGSSARCETARGPRRSARSTPPRPTYTSHCSSVVERQPGRARRSPRRSPRTLNWATRENRQVKSAGDRQVGDPTEAAVEHRASRTRRPRGRIRREPAVGTAVPPARARIMPKAARSIPTGSRPARRASAGGSRSTDGFAATTATSI